MRNWTVHSGRHESTTSPLALWVGRKLKGEAILQTGGEGVGMELELEDAVANDENIATSC